MLCHQYKYHNVSLKKETQIDSPHCMALVVHQVILISNREISHALTHIYGLFRAEMQESAVGRLRSGVLRNAGKGGVLLLLAQTKTASLCGLVTLRIHINKTPVVC